MSETVQLRFKHTEEEWVAASRFFMTGQPGMLVRLGALFLLIVLCFVFFALISEAAMSLFMLSLGLVIFSLVSALLLVVPRQRFRSDPRFKDEFFLEFTDEEIHYHTSQVDSRLSWSLYTRVLENERFYVLVYGKNMISVIPKRAFITSHQETIFRNLLRRKLGHTKGSRWLTEPPSQQLENAYVPPAEPPDWR